MCIKHADKQRLTTSAGCESFYVLYGGCEEGLFPHVFNAEHADKAEAMIDFRFCKGPFDCLFSPCVYLSADCRLRKCGNGIQHILLSYTYDALGRVSARTAECGVAAGNLTSAYEYVEGGYGTNSTTPLVKKITQNGISFEYTYDNRGNIISEKRGNLTTTYAYDALGQLIRVNDPHENATWVFNYDCGGNILSKAKYAYTTGTVGTALETIPYSLVIPTGRIN